MNEPQILQYFLKSKPQINTVFIIKEKQGKQQKVEFWINLSVISYFKQKVKTYHKILK